MTSKLPAVTGHWLNELLWCLTQNFLNFFLFQHQLKHVWKKSEILWPKQICLISTTFPGLECKCQVPELFMSTWTIKETLPLSGYLYFTTSYFIIHGKFDSHINLTMGIVPGRFQSHKCPAHQLWVHQFSFAWLCLQTGKKRRATMELITKVNKHW